MFLLNSCLDLFSAACSRRHPFSRSYGVILPSSLTMLLPSALGFSPHPPVSVYGTGSYITIAAFLDGWLTCFATLWFATHHVFPLPEGFASLTGTSLAPVFPFPGQAFQPCPYSSEYMKYRNLYLLSIDYGFRPRLRSRLTQSGRTFLWKPWVFGAWDSHPRSATHTGILSSMISTRPFGRTSPFMERSPTIPWDP